MTFPKGQIIILMNWPDATCMAKYYGDLVSWPVFYVVYIHKFKIIRSEN